MHREQSPRGLKSQHDQLSTVDRTAGAAVWSACLNGTREARQAGPIVVGVLPGEGVGPEVVGAALDVLASVAEASGVDMEICTGGCIGRDAEVECGQPLSEQVSDFCANVFARGGAIINGPGGGRYVYDLRRRLDLFLKISPLQPINGLPDASRMKFEALRDVDVIITRENAGGAYQGRWSDRHELGGDRVAEHTVTYSAHQVARFLDASARLAKSRRGEMAVVWKESGVPSISRLWRECAEQAAATHGVEWRMIDIDLMAYRLIHEPAAFDVVAAPNLFGDVLADLGAVLLGSRGASYSGNFTERGDGVYQTNHGAAYDIAGKDAANPAGQILALAMMLRESFGLMREAEAVQAAMRSVWRDGYRTSDVTVNGARVIGTRDMGRRVAERAARFLGESAQVVIPATVCNAVEMPVT